MENQAQIVSLPRIGEKSALVVTVKLVAARAGVGKAALPTSNASMVTKMINTNETLSCLCMYFSSFSEIPHLLKMQVK